MSVLGWNAPGMHGFGVVFATQLIAKNIGKLTAANATAAPLMIHLGVGI